MSSQEGSIPPQRRGNLPGSSHRGAPNCLIPFKNDFTLKIEHVGATTLDLYEIRPGVLNKCFGAIAYLSGKALDATERGFVDKCITQICVEILSRSGVGTKQITAKEHTPKEFHPNTLLKKLIAAALPQSKGKLPLQGTVWEKDGFEDLAIAAILLYAIKPYYKTGGKQNFDYFTTRVSKIKAGGTITDEEEKYIISVGTLLQATGTPENQGVLNQAMHNNIDRAQMIQLILYMEESTDSKVKGIGGMCKLVASFHNFTKVKLVIDMLKGTFEPVAFRPYGSQAIRFGSAVRSEKDFFTLRGSGGKVQEMFEFSRVIDQNNCPSLTEAKFRELYELGVYYHKAFKKEDFTNFQGANTDKIPEHIKEMVKNGNAGGLALESEKNLKQLGFNPSHFNRYRRERERSRSPIRHYPSRRRDRPDRSRDAGYNTREPSPHSSDDGGFYM